MLRFLRTAFILLFFYVLIDILHSKDGFVSCNILYVDLALALVFPILNEIIHFFINKYKNTNNG